MRVLLVEDEAGLVSALRVALQREGYAVDTAGRVAEAQEKLAVTTYDIVLLDVNLPDGDGFELAASIRSRGATPTRILMLTARGQLRDRVRGLDLGADDYLVKPFALVELTARMRALTRRDGDPSAAVLVDGPILLDTARQLARRGDRELSLTLKEFGVLRYLLRRIGYVVSAEELLEHVWDENADPFTQTVRVTVGTLRRKLSVDGEEAAIETVVGRGYRLRELADEPALFGTTADEVTT
ncbi:DNA-binding response regulator [Curtobacterium sp. BH-2-1-1]|uniref:response regulator transcription factor n=1 Tax=Curtobacterium sp. BH-2-1-1 TaxID=1905847 RepID=UPI00089E095A|nr:response regulator transcription factor [Curtobacterium sp. BH-2-1-1]AOX66232.1 DNA-binding response regulator [Curtobacterium sp. BH-2-1-1]